MLRTIIVDDDINMLNGLINFISWENYGFSVVGKAENGIDALKMVTDIKPDVIITDITMPAMNGMELIREAKKFKPDIKAIILTCHEDFIYAKEAIELEADDYIVKYTLTEGVLIKGITRLKERIQKEEKQKELVYRANRVLENNKYLITEKLFLDIIDNTYISRDEISNIAVTNNICLPNGSFRAIGLFVDNFKDAIKMCPIKEYNLFKLSVLNIIEEIMQGVDNFVLVPYNQGTFILLLWDNGNHISIKQKIIDRVKEIHKNILKYLKVSTSSCFSSNYESILEFKNALSELEELRESYFYSGSGAIATERIKFRDCGVHALHSRFNADFKAALGSCDAIKIRENTDRIIKLILEGIYPPRVVKSLFRRLIVDLESISGRYGIMLKELHFEWDTFEKIKDVFYEGLMNFIEEVNRIKMAPTRKEINMVIEYIDSHLHEGISCEKMASYINMNINYFSRLFKNEMGMSFSDYLMKKRMEYATLLLTDTNYSIDDITRAIGFENANYFYKVYKKNCGKTPGNIRSSSRKII